MDRLGKDLACFLTALLCIGIVGWLVVLGEVIAWGVTK